MLFSDARTLQSHRLKTPFDSVLVLGISEAILAPKADLVSATDDSRRRPSAAGKIRSDNRLSPRYPRMVAYIAQMSDCLPENRLDFPEQALEKCGEDEA
jgi:hypothetical protein